MTHPSALLSLETQAVHAGREVLHEQGVHAMPIDLSSTYPVQDLDEGGRSLEAMAMGGLPIGSPVYARLYNPTVARYEQAPVSYTHLRAHETDSYLVCRLLLEK